MAKSDADFLTALEKSRHGVELVARWLKEKGYDVHVKQAEVRPTFEQRMNYADTGDIEVRKRVEVKHRNIPFTCREDFPYATIFVDEAYKINRIPPNTLASYIILNRDSTHIAVVDPATQDMWFVEDKFDPTHGEVRPTFVCPIDLVRFIKL